MSRLVSVLGRPLRGQARRYVEAEVQRRLRGPLGLTPITEIGAEDVIIAGYPKSGNSWFQKLAAGVLYGIDTRLAPDALIQDIVIEVDFKRWYRRYRTPTLFRSHHLPRENYRRAVYLLRDGRDVMVSNLHFRANLEGRNFDLLRMVRDGEGLYPCRWHEHVDAWMVNPYGTDLLIIRYEDLLTDCLQELRRFCAFMGEDRDDEFLERVVQNASVDNMRKNEQQFGWSHRPTWPADKSFIRRAQSGSYRDEMPLEIQALFEEQAGKTLRECGYLSSADDALARS